VISATKTVSLTSGIASNSKMSKKMRPSRTFHLRLRRVAAIHGQPRTSLRVRWMIGRPLSSNRRTRRARGVSQAPRRTTEAGRSNAEKTLLEMLPSAAGYLATRPTE
jgi:hypothetical protein